MVGGFAIDARTDQANHPSESDVMPEKEKKKFFFSVLFFRFSSLVCWRWEVLSEILFFIIVLFFVLFFFFIILLLLGVTFFCVGSVWLNLIKIRRFGAFPLRSLALLSSFSP